MAEPCGDKPGQEQGTSLGGLQRAGGPPGQTGSPKQCGILQGCVQGGAVDSPAVSVLGNWGVCGSIPAFQGVGDCPVHPALLGEQQPEFSDNGLCQPHQPVLPQEMATRNAEQGNFGVL